MSIHGDNAKRPRRSFAGRSDAKVREPYIASPQTSASPRGKRKSAEAPARKKGKARRAGPSLVVYERVQRGGRRRQLFPDVKSLSSLFLPRFLRPPVRSLPEKELYSEGEKRATRCREVLRCRTCSGRTLLVVARDSPSRTSPCSLRRRRRYKF